MIKLYLIKKIRFYHYIIDIPNIKHPHIFIKRFTKIKSTVQTSYDYLLFGIIRKYSKINNGLIFFFEKMISKTIYLKISGQRK